MKPLWALSQIKSMIYADYAATSGYHPEAVKKAILDVLDHPGNVGRGSHEAAMKASRIVYLTRKKISDFFDADGAENVVFSSGITESLNVAIKGLIKPGDHVITTYAEHNSVLRPLYELNSKGTKLSITAPDADMIKAAIRPDTKAVVMTNASNVTGEVYDIKSVGRLCRDNNILFIVDTAQSAGIVPVSMKDNNIDVLCFAGHKGLAGPQGIGGMCVRKDVYITPFITGGSGVHSFSKTQPEDMPVRLEAGTPNVPGIAGLGAAIDYINELGIHNVTADLAKKQQYFYENIKDIQGIKVYGRFDTKCMHTPTFSLNIGEYDSGVISNILDEEYGIATRSGAHCAPLMHEHYGTNNQGMVRFSFGLQSSYDDMDKCVEALKNIASE